MKKLLKYEWKRYLVVIFLTGVLLMGHSFYEIHLWGIIEQAYKGEIQMSLLGTVIDCYISDLPRLISIIATEISDSLLNVSHIFIVLTVLFLMKCFRYWDERNAYGREFVVMLPVKGRIRKAFYVAADVVFVIASIFIYTVGMLVYVNYFFADNAIELPWLTKAVIGEMITSIAYLLMILGVVEFLEILFVDGGIKAGGIVVIFVMLRYLLETGADAFYKTEWVQDVQGFLSLEKVGNQYACIENGFIEWTHDVTHPEILFKGELLTEAVLEKSQWLEDVIWYWGNPEFSRMYNFIHISTYGGYVIGYLAIGCVLMGIAIWLAGKTEASKSGFYFVFGRYLLSVLIGGTFFVVCMEGAEALWHKIIIVIATVCVTVILLYKMNPERKSA